MMAKATQFCVGLENKPGKLARLCATLREAGVKIEALFVSDDEGCTWVNLLVDGNEAAEKALKAADYHFFTEQVLKVLAADGPGRLEQIAASLAEADVNINYVYGSCSENAPFTLVLHVSDRDKAAEVLGA
jgi:hypothetical protein